MKIVMSLRGLFMTQSGLTNRLTLVVKAAFPPGILQIAPYPIAIEHWTAALCVAMVPLPVTMNPETVTMNPTNWMKK